MTICTPCILEGYMDRFGWTYKASRPSIWKTGFSGDDTVYSLEVQLSDTSVRFEMFPLVDFDIKWDLWPEILEELYEIGDSQPVLNLCVDKKELLLLSCESAIVGFDYNNFCNIVGVLGHHADRVREKIRSVLNSRGYDYFSEPSYLS